MTDDEYMQEFCNKSKNRRNLEEENLMDNLEDLDVSITDESYQAGLQEIINNLKTIEPPLLGEKEMLDRIINYLERCL